MRRYLLVFGLLAACSSEPFVDVGVSSGAGGGAENPPTDAGADGDAEGPVIVDAAPTCMPEACLAASGYNPACAVMGCVDGACSEVRLRPDDAPCQFEDLTWGVCLQGVCVPAPDGGAP